MGNLVFFRYPYHPQYYLNIDRCAVKRNKISIINFFPDIDVHYYFEISKNVFRQLIILYYRRTRFKGRDRCCQ